MVGDIPHFAFAKIATPSRADYAMPRLLDPTLPRKRSARYRAYRELSLVHGA